MRSEFEKLPYVKSRLSLVFFVDCENAYLPHKWDDENSVGCMHFVNGAWYAYQEQQKVIDGLKKELSKLSQNGSKRGGYIGNKTQESDGVVHHGESEFRGNKNLINDIQKALNKDKATHQCFYEGKLRLLKTDTDRTPLKLNLFHFWHDDLEKWIPVPRATISKNQDKIEKINKD